MFLFKISRVKQTLLRWVVPVLLPVCSFLLLDVIFLHNVVAPTRRGFLTLPAAVCRRGWSLQRAEVGDLGLR